MKGLLFTYALTYGGAIASLFNPYYGFLIYVCFGIVRPSSMWSHSVPAGNYSQIIAIALAMGWLLHGMGNWRFGRARGVVLALLAFWGITLLSMLLAPNVEVAWTYFDNLSKILLPLLMGVTLIDSIEKVTQLIWVIVLSQGYIAYEMNSHYFAGYNRYYLDGFGGLDNNGVALNLVSTLGLAFFLALRERSLWRKGVVTLLLLLIMHGVLLSYSRAAMLAMIICACVIFAMLPKRPMYVAAFVVMAMIGLRLAGPQLIARFSTTFAAREQRDESAETRLDLWTGCLHEMVANPILGIGPDHWKLVSHRHPGCGVGRAAHSTWMQSAAETGVLGLAAILAFYGLLAWRLWSLANQQIPSDDSLISSARMVFCSLIAFGIAAQFISAALIETPYYIAAAGIGALKLSAQYSGQNAFAAGWSLAPTERELRQVYVG